MSERTLAHLTLNDGHTRDSPRSEVAGANVDRLAPFVADGGALPAPAAGYRVTVTRDDHPPGCATFTVLGPRYEPQVTGFVCADAAHSERMWGVAGGGIAAFHGKHPNLVPLRHMPPRPATAPWLAVLLWPTINGDASTWLGDFERCFAWALIAGEG